MKKGLIVLVFILAVLLSRNVSLPQDEVVKAQEATSDAVLDLQSASPTPNFCEDGPDDANDDGSDDCIDVPTPTLSTSPTPDFCEDGPDDVKDDDSDDCIDVSPTPTKPAPPGGGPKDDHEDEDEDVDDNAGGGVGGGGAGGGPGGGPSVLGAAGGFVDSLMSAFLISGLALMTFGANYGKKKKS